MARKSKYAGEIAREKTQFTVCRCVGELKRAIADLPDELPLDSDGVLPVWFNLGHDDGRGMLEHLGLEEPDDWLDDDEDEDWDD